MKTDSLASILRAHLNERGLRLAGAGGPLDTISEEFAIRELAEVAVDVFAVGEITQVIPLSLLEDLVTEARVA